MKDNSTVKLMILWHGAVVPSYRYFFEALAKRVELVVVSPKSWKHGSKVYRLPVSENGIEPDSRGNKDKPEREYFPHASGTGYRKNRPESNFSPESYRLLGMSCWFPGTSRYILPAWPLVLRRYRPTHVYIMDEVDRMSTFWHALAAQVTLPGCRITTYSLQNLERPEYYRWYHRLFFTLNLALVHNIIAATPEALKVLQPRQNNISPRELVSLSRPVTLHGPVPLGVSPQFFQPGDKKSLRQKKNFSPEKTLVLFAGSLHPSKGVDMLMEAAKELSHLQFVFIGEGPLLQPLQNLKREHIHAIPAVPGERLREYYQMCDYVILPSRTTPHWKEQVGRLLLEGILCGAVALGSDSGNIPDITRVKEASFSQGNQQGLLSLLQSLPLKNHQEVYRRQREHVGQHYEWEAVAGQTLHCLESA